MSLIDIKVVLNQINYSLPYDYYQRMHGYIISLLGDNSYGSMNRDFIYTNLIGGDNKKEGIVFNNEPYFIIRTNNDEIIKKFLININSHKELFLGLTVKYIVPPVEVDCNKNVFFTVKQSPILVSKTFNWQNVLTSEDIAMTEKYLLNNIIEKAKNISFNIDENLSIKIVSQYNCKDINYNNIINKGRVFKFKIECNNETKEFILLNGLGRSCGSGFGFIN